MIVDELLALDVLENSNELLLSALMQLLPPSGSLTHTAEVHQSLHQAFFNLQLPLGKDNEQLSTFVELKEHCHRLALRNNLSFETLHESLMLQVVHPMALIFSRPPET